MSGPSSQTWLAIEKPDRTLENILKGIRKFAAIDLAERPRISLEWSTDSVWLRSPNPDALFLRLFRDRPTPVRALSLAPESALRRLHNKTFQHQGSRYRIRRCRLTDFPYYRRFLDLEYLEAGVQLDTDEAQVRIDRVTPKEVNADALLWLDPQPLELDDDEVVYLFGSGAGTRRLGADMAGAVFLPPVRGAGHPDLCKTDRAGMGLDSPAGSYFSADLTRLRAAHMAPATYSRAVTSEPTAVTISRLVDDPLLRDVLLDGGSIRVNSVEGRRTSLSLDIHSADLPGSWYRALAILDPDGAEGPAWARGLMRAIHEDVYGLVEGGWQIAAADPTSARPQWRLQQLRPYRPGGYDGTWSRIQHLCNTLDIPADLRNICEHRILLPTRERLGEAESPPDNDLVELLFLHDLWRCPWRDEIDEISWRRAMLELLLDGFLTSGVTPEQRVTSWNRIPAGSPEAGGDNHGFGFIYQRRAHDGEFVLRYSGSPDDACVLKWRLLLPLGTIVNARTLYLDSGQRSQLDAGFVLA